jgi:hypothetical protein
MHQYLGVSGSWPAQCVFDAGLVSRLRVYGVFGRGQNAQSPIIPHRYYNVSYGETQYLLATNTVAHADYADDEFGTGYAFSSYLDQTLTSIGKSSSSYSITQMAPGPPADWTLNLLIDANTPTNFPLFTFGCGPVDITQLSVRQSSTNMFSHEFYYYEQTANFKYQHALYLLALVTVVDWDFPCYSLAGGDAAPYTPPWMTNSIQHEAP